MFFSHNNSTEHSHDQDPVDLNQSTGVPAPQQQLSVQIERFDSKIPMPLETAIEIGYLFEEIYGAEYPDYIIHDPQMFCQKLLDGELISFVARASDGTLLGHAALVSYGPHSYEFGRDVVSPSARGYGLSKLLVQERLQFVHEHAADLEISDVVSETVTGHERSQNTYLKNDFVPTGVYAGIYTDFFSRGVRETTILKTRVIDESILSHRTVFLPHEYALLASYTYNSLQAEREIACGMPAAISLSTEASYSLHIDDIGGFGMLKGKIETAGSIQSLIQDLASYQAQGAQYAAVGIPLDTEAALGHIYALQQEGFVFCGIHCERDHDLLFMQKIPDCWLSSSDQLCIVSPQAKLLVEFIKKELELRSRA